MDIPVKLQILADAAKYDASCASSGSDRKRTAGGLGNGHSSGICHSYTPDGRCVSLLKILLTNFCIYDCRYCINRASSAIRRARFTPEEVVKLTIDFYKRNYIEGLFLSSGVVTSPDDTMADLARVAKLLREDHKFCGYIHLKAVPGASAEMLTEAGRYADRVSANIELVEQKDLDVLAPGKNHAEIETTMSRISEGIRESKEEARRPVPLASRAVKPRLFLPAGQSTQLIVGATPSSDRTILEKSSELYRRHRLRRVYYSAFSPIPDSDPLLSPVSPPLMREHRLYQADWLLRFYGFGVNELVTNADRNLDLNKDPKLAWALSRRDLFPVNINTAGKELLLRVPGLGVRNVLKILSSRRHRKLRLEDLQRLRVPLARTRYFVETADWNPALRRLESASLEQLVTYGHVQQMSLFEAPRSAVHGEL